MQKKKITINIRVDETMYSEMLEKAQLYFRGNLSALIRCATAKYTEEAEASEQSGNHPQLVALISTAIKKIDKIGVNHNQLVRSVNEKMKLSPLAFQPSDLQPLTNFGDGLHTVEEMLRYLYNMMQP